MIRILLASIALSFATGCSTLGISLYPTGHFLTEDAEEVLRQAPASASLPKELDMSVLHEHYLQPGDALLIEPVVFSDNVRLPADQQVLADGTIDLGGFGRVQVAGLTVETAEAAIEERLVAMEADPAQVNVRLLDSVDRYYILGEVQSPGAYPLVGNETVLDGVLQAGGLTDRAAPCKILLARPTPPGSCRVTLPICYRQITQLGDTTTNYQLQPGDRVYVASRTCLEELMFWQASKTCDRCSPCQSPCCHPEANGYQSPLSPALPMGPPVPPWSQDPQRESPRPLRATPGMLESNDVPGAASSDAAPPLVPRTPVPTDAPEAASAPDPNLGELDFDRPLPPLPKK